MSQAEILTWLQQHEGWHRWKEIANGAELSPQTVSHKLLLLRKKKLVDRRTERGVVQYRYMEAQ